MMKSHLTDILNIEVPLIQAPMAGVSTPALAAAVTNAGGLGSIAVGAIPPEKARQNIEELKSATNGKFNVNVFTHDPAVKDEAREARWLETMRPLFEEFGATPPDQLEEIYRSFKSDEAMLSVLCETAPAIVSFHFGLPSADKIAALKEMGIFLIASATTVEEARAVEAAGIDAVVAQGWEAGGHRGAFDVSADQMIGSMALVPQVVDAVSIPVIAAGGIGDGRGVAAAFALGASAVQLGTAFVGAAESSANEAYRTMLAGARAGRTAVTSAISGRPARGIENRFMREMREGEAAAPDYPITYDAGKALAGAAAAGNNDEFAAMWAGQAARYAKFAPAQKILNDIWSDARSRMAELSSISS